MTMTKDVLTALYQLEGEKVFDFVFMDPPYDQDLERQVLTYLSGSELIYEDTVIIVEASKHTDFSYLEDLGFTLIKEKNTRRTSMFSLRSWKGNDMLRAIYPGSFDPVTYGHLDIIRRSCKIVDELVVGVLNNNVENAVVSVEERVKMLEEATKDLTNVRIVPFHGLLIDFARQMDAFVIIRGLRAITDFEYELQMSQTNHKLEPDLETMFLTTSIEYSYLSSTTVREIAAYGGDVSQFVPEAVAGELEAKMKAKRRV